MKDKVPFAPTAIRILGASTIINSVVMAKTARSVEQSWTLGVLVGVGLLALVLSRLWLDSRSRSVIYFSGGAVQGAVVFLVFAIFLPGGPASLGLLGLALTAQLGVIAVPTTQGT